jgi:hypothetical protein
MGIPQNDRKNQDDFMLPSIGDPAICSAKSNNIERLEKRI